MSGKSTNNCSVFMEIRAGSPGDEGARAVGNLYRIYGEFAAEKGWQMEVLGSRPVPDCGFRKIIANIEGKGVFEMLRFEKGLHRIQHMIRQQGQDRMRTLLVHIDILPLPRSSELRFGDAELSVNCFRLPRPDPGSIDGADSVSRITHIPSGIEAEQRNDAAHFGDSDKAMKVLRARVFQNWQNAPPQILNRDNSQPVRTYNIPQSRISDRRISTSLLEIADVISSKALASVIEALITAVPEKRGQDGG